MIDKAKILLNKDWPQEQYNLIKRLFDNLLSYKAFIPNALKNDIIAMLDIAISIKEDYDILKSKDREIIKECIHDMMQDKRDLNYEIELHDKTCQTEIDNYKAQPFSLVVSEDGTITFTINSKENKNNSEKDVNDNKNLNGEGTLEGGQIEGINDMEIINGINEIEIIEDKKGTGINKNKKKNKWRGFFCF